MTNYFISGRSISELYKYLQTNVGFYNDLKSYFSSYDIEPKQNVVSYSTRNKDQFLDKYIKPLKLSNRDDSEKLIGFITQALQFPITVEEEDLVESLRQDGWSLKDKNFVRPGQNVAELIQNMLSGYPVSTIRTEWDRAISSISSDPADSLTAASSMIEATYKYILHSLNKPLPANKTLRGLSKAVHSILKISPDQEADEDFRSILNGVITIANSLSSIRTKIGDAL